MKKLVLIFIASFLIFYPSLFAFFTNDDFFFLKISNVGSFRDFIQFFNIFSQSGDFGFFRPLTTQLFYFLDVKLFNLNPFPLHLISFVIFFGVIFLVYKLALEITKSDKVSLIAAFLYAVSATHFGHLYYLATFQELGMTLFVFLSILTFLRKRPGLSLLFFILALASKETAVVTPILIGLVSLYKQVNMKKLLTNLIPFAVCLLVYLLVHQFVYGFNVGSEYVLDFSIRKMINTLFWYSLWSLNLPETLLDFVGPGLSVNPNLITYWSKQITPIFILFFVQGLGLIYLLFRSLSAGKKISLLSVLWFFVALLPVLFLPSHKFTFYLTLPLVAVVIRIAYLFESAKVGKTFIFIFLSLWTILSVLTLKHTVNTHWISQGEGIAKRVNTYFEKNSDKLTGHDISFVDSLADSSLPWSPTDVVKIALSDKNFFYVFYPELADKVGYNTSSGALIYSRIFLGY